MGSLCSLYINNVFALLTLLFLFVSNGDAEAMDPYDNLRYLSQSAGYVKLSKTKGPAGIFYFFFEERQNKKTDTLIVWLNGGPGCSSLGGLFNENGPFKLTKNLSLVWNKYGWDQASNILYVDQPIGTGFSYYTHKSDIPKTSEEAAVHFYEFLQAFFTEHPKFLRNAFYITGESYAGHYIPAMAALINNQNKKGKRLHINLKGMAMGNSWTNSGVQTATYRYYALNMKLINRSQYNKFSKPVNNCLKEVNNVCTNGTRFNWTACAQAFTDCNVIYSTIMALHPGLNPYDIRKNCTGECYDSSRMERFLNQVSVKKALRVNERMKFVDCGNPAYYAMAGDEMRNLAVYIPELLEDGVKLLLYAGEYDFICNWLGNSKWAHEMKWSGQRCFNATAYTPFTVDNVEVGSQKSCANLTFLKFYNAGHMVPLDQPKPALEMLRRWMKGSSPL